MNPTAKIQVNEVFGPTIQGEGMEMGMPCIFLRLHNCPVKCPGCDTAYTWNGTENGKSLPLFDHPLNEMLSLEGDLVRKFTEYPGAGLVVSGGEPLLYHRNEDFRKLLVRLTKDELAPWVSLETSGFLGLNPLFSKFVDVFKLPDYSDLDKFLACFTSVHLSPKITPCLHGTGWTDESLTNNVATILMACKGIGNKIALKLVARDEADCEAILKFCSQFEPYLGGVPIYVMPYGQERDEVAANTEKLIPFCATYGFILTPRIQCLLWGKKRAV